VNERIEKYAELIGERMAERSGDGYAFAVGMISAIVDHPTRTAAEQVDDIRDVLTALNRASDRTGGVR